MVFSSLKTENVERGSGEKLAKFWMYLTSAVMAVNLFLILTLLQMTPKLQVIAQILTNSPMQSNQLLQTEPFSQRGGEKNLIDETLVRFYMDMRHSSFHDQTELEYRWGRGGAVARLSAPNVYEKFAAGRLDNLQSIANAQTTTSIDILSLTRLDNIFTIEFDVYTYNRGMIESTRKIAIVTVGYNPSRKFYNTNYSNPFGMFVRSYEESVKKK